jgi:choline-sulfatase
VLQALRESDLDKDTLVVALGDHGESLGEHREATHGVLIYESTLRVPLLMAGPGVPVGLVAPDRVGTVDVVPTVLGLLGAAPPAGLPGRDLRPAFSGKRLPRSAQYAESLFGRLNFRWSSLRSWTEGDWKLISGAEPELYDLSQDPGENTNRAAVERERTRRMLESLDAAVGSMAPGGDRPHAASITPEKEERLRSLGYAAGGTGGAGAADEPGLPDPKTRVQLYEALEQLLSAPLDVAASAADAAAEATAEDPGNPFAFFTLGSLARRAGQFRRAEEALGRSLQLDSDRPAIRAYLGEVFRDMGRLEESERELKIAVEQTTSADLRTRINLAETLIASGKLKEAEELLTRVLSQAPHSALALGAKGRLLLAEGRGPEAVTSLRQACVGTAVDPWIELASAQLSLGDVAGARESAGRALALDPRHTWALAVSGHVLVLEGRRAEGLRVLREALAAGPRQPRVWRSLGQAFAAAGDTDAAARCRRAAEESIR